MVVFGKEEMVNVRGHDKVTHSNPESTDKEREMGTRLRAPSVL